MSVSSQFTFIKSTRALHITFSSGLGYPCYPDQTALVGAFDTCKIKLLTGKFPGRKISVCAELGRVPENNFWLRKEVQTRAYQLLGNHAIAAVQ